MLATTLGLLAAALVWRLTRASGGMLGWVLPMVYSFLAFSVVAPLFLMLTADLRLKPAATAAEPEPAATGQDRKSTRLNSSHIQKSRMPSSA